MLSGRLTCGTCCSSTRNGALPPCCGDRGESILAVHKTGGAHEDVGFIGARLGARGGGRAGVLEGTVERHRWRLQCPMDRWSLYRRLERGRLVPQREHGDHQG